jgi:hypothetical protein
MRARRSAVPGFDFPWRTGAWFAARNPRDERCSRTFRTALQLLKLTYTGAERKGMRRTACTILALLVIAVLGGCGDEGSAATSPPVEESVPETTTEPDPTTATSPPVEESVPEDATEPDPVTGAPIPAAGTAARDDMERLEIACFDSGRTDCADQPGDYLEDPSSYP